MNLPTCNTHLAAVLLTVRCTGAEYTCAGQTGASILRMAQAYECDGKTFRAKNDPVNALAAFLYGFGWLHCGITAGLIAPGAGTLVCPLNERFDPLPEACRAKRDEKCERYKRLLATALTSISPSPDPATPPGAFSQKVLVVAGAYLCRGECERAAHFPEDALACFSYGHGWIDAGVQAGLFSIHAHREIFTVD